VLKLLSITNWLQLKLATLETGVTDAGEMLAQRTAAMQQDCMVSTNNMLKLIIL
jgi:hypothetical protein